MTKATQPLTIEQMTEWLYGRAEEIFLLCCIINRRGLAHAFCDLSGHVEMLDCHIQPIDASYQTGNFTPAIARLRLFLRIDDDFSEETQQRQYLELQEELDTYVSYLDYLIERNEPVTIESQEHAA